MARLELSGLDALDDMFARLGEIPGEVRSQALAAMAQVAQSAVRRTGEAMGVRDPESQVHILDKITHSKPRKTAAGGYSDVTFSGTRTRGKGKKTRNAEIAFINEYVTRSQPARPFIATAAEQYADAIAEPGEKIIGDWFEKSTK